MKVIFLDFDGVINDVRTKNRGTKVEEKYVNLLKMIISATNANVIATSSHKNEFIGKDYIKRNDGPHSIKHDDTSCFIEYEKPLLEMGVKIYDYTPNLKKNFLDSRELEIDAYLHLHPEIEEFVIVEDEHVISKYADHQVLIEYANGLSIEHVEPAINILNGNLGFYPPSYDQTETLEHRIKRIF